jgi:hypothetical protein
MVKQKQSQMMLQPRLLSLLPRMNSLQAGLVTLLCRPLGLLQRSLEAVAKVEAPAAAAAAAAVTLPLHRLLLFWEAAAPEEEEARKEVRWVHY